MVDIDDVDPEFIALCIASSEAQRWLTGVVKGAAYKGINLADLRQLEIPVPDKGEQANFVSSVSDLRQRLKELARSYEKQVGDIEQLRQSLLQAAFSGQLN